MKWIIALFISFHFLVSFHSCVSNVTLIVSLWYTPLQKLTHLLWVDNKIFDTNIYIEFIMCSFELFLQYLCYTLFSHPRFYNTNMQTPPIICSISLSLLHPSLIYISVYWWVSHAFTHFMHVNVYLCVCVRTISK